MTPQERLEFEEMKRTLRAIQSVQDVPFIENIKRRGAQGLVAGDLSSASSINTTARNAADNGSVAVASDFDTKLQILLPNGTVYYLGAYTS